MAILHPARFTVTSIAILQQSASTLRWSLESVLDSTDSFQRQLTDIKNLYEVSDVVNKISDGTLPYPSSSDKKQTGMAFELRYEHFLFSKHATYFTGRHVSFSYPGNKSTTNALNDVSLSIKAGQLVVIVGSNGSGKSTVLKLLSRLYDPTDGEILCDGIPIQKYCMRDLRRATATLTQDHHLFPLSLAENIGLGNPENIKDDAMILQAAEQGGATSCIAKMVDGTQTILDPLQTAYGCNLRDDPDDPLQKQLKKLEKKVELSGGEKQRMVA